VLDIQASLPGLGSEFAGFVTFLRNSGIPAGGIITGVVLGFLLYLFVEALRSRPKALLAGKVPIRVVAPDEAPISGEASKRMVPVQLFSGTEEKTILMTGAGEHPSQPLPRARVFVLVWVITFLAVSVVLLAFFVPLFGAYDHLVGLVGTLLYWPLAWPGIYAVGPNTLAVPDYIFPMYLSAMAGLSVATGLWWNRPERSFQRRISALAIVLIYFGVEVVLDALFFTVPGNTLRDFALLARAITGGFFLALLLFCVLHLPRAQEVKAKLARDRGAIASFLAVGSLSLVGAILLVGVLPYSLGFNHVVLGLTLLLLVPAVTLELFGVFSRPLYARSLRKHPPPPLSAYHPDVSILIPAYNEEEWIEGAIMAADAGAANYPGHVEIVVGNDGSTDRTSELARAAIRRLKYSEGKIVDLPHGGKSNALNGALAVSQGEIVVRCDADTKISEELGFAALIPHFADPEVGGVQGAIHPRQRSGWTRKMRAMEIAWNHYFLRPAMMGTRSAMVVDGEFSAFRRQDLIDNGGWVRWNGEDTEITLRLEGRGYRLRFETAALAYEDVPRDYNALRKQRVRWARGLTMAMGQHYPALLGDTPEFGGLAFSFWFLMFVRSGVRSMVYIFLLALILILGIPALIATAFLLLIVMAIRAIPLGFYLLRMGRADVLPWIPFFSIANILKQTFRFEAFGTLGPSAVGEYV
jgi:cellulose synthase/poly-beta-1,6-N-acetylglucosamine synthase-like glycosyltransferase